MNFPQDFSAKQIETRYIFNHFGKPRFSSLKNGFFARLICRIPHLFPPSPSLTWSLAGGVPSHLPRRGRKGEEKRKQKRWNRKGGGNSTIIANESEGERQREGEREGGREGRI